MKSVKGQNCFFLLLLYSYYLSLLSNNGESYVDIKTSILPIRLISRFE